MNHNNIDSTLGIAITNKNNIAVVDGSYCPYKRLGTACWIITDKHTTTKLKGSTQVPGGHVNMEAYRAELFGLYCILLFIKLYCQYFNIEKGVIEIACDCESTVKNALCNAYKPTVSPKHYNLLAAIFNLSSEIPITLKFRHVRGHKDK